MNRIMFFNSISGIDYPFMLANYYDQFLALKDLVSGYDTINVIACEPDSITFSIVYSDMGYKNQSLSVINSFPGRVFIYGKYIPVKIDNLTDIEIRLTLMK